MIFFLSILEFQFYGVKCNRCSEIFLVVVFGVIFGDISIGSIEIP